MKTRLLTILLLCVISSAFADMGPFVEANIGSSSATTSMINQNGQTFTSNNDQSFAWNINVGAMFFGLGLEAGYIRFADINYQNNIGQSTTATLNETHIALRSTHNIGPIFLLGKLGYGHLQRGSFSINGTNVNGDSTSGLFWGLGAGLKLTPFWRLQAEYQQVQGTNNVPTASIITLGAGWTFL